MDQITTYATLQSAVAGMTHREGDTTFTASIPLFVQLCEAELNDRLLLKDTEQEDSLTSTIGQNYIALPAGFISPIKAWLVVDGERVSLYEALPQELPYDTSSTQPKYWAVDGVNLRFDCPADKAYVVKFRYVKRSNLSDSNTSNYLLLKRPDVYLYGVLKQAALYEQDDNNLPKWSGLYEKGIATLKAAENRNRSMVPLRSEACMGSGRSNIYRGE